MGGFGGGGYGGGMGGGRGVCFDFQKGQVTPSHPTLTLTLT